MRLRSWITAGGLLAVACSGTAENAVSDPAPTHSSTAATGTAASGGGAQERLAAARAVHTATLLGDGRLLVVGGCAVDGCSTATNSAMLLDAHSNRRAADLAHPRDAHTATLLADGSVLVVGGFAAEGTPPLRSAERYLPTEDRWVPTSDVNLGRGSHAAAMLGDERVLIAGGWTLNGDPTATTEIFDPATQAFTMGPALPAAVDALAAAALPDGSVLVTGGRRPGDVSVAFAVVIAADGTLTGVANLAQARFKHEMVALASGEVLVLGGTSDDRELLRSTEIYSPATRTFRPGPTLSQGRYKLTGGVAVLPDGRVLVGSGGTGVEVLDTATGTSVPVQGAPARRSLSASVDVIGDQVIVLGGYGDRIALTHTEWRMPLSDLPEA